MTTPSIGFYPCIPSWRMNHDVHVQVASTYYRPPNGACSSGEHDFELVPEDSVNGLFTGGRDRLVLYCRRCGTTVKHDLSSPPESPNDP